MIKPYLLSLTPTHIFPFFPPSVHYPQYSLNVASMYLKLGRLYLGLEKKTEGVKALKKVLCIFLSLYNSQITQDYRTMAFRKYYDFILQSYVRLNVLGIGWHACSWHCVIGRSSVWHEETICKSFCSFPYNEHANLQLLFSLWRSWSKTWKGFRKQKPAQSNQQAVWHLQITIAFG